MNQIMLGKYIVYWLAYNIVIGIVNQIKDQINMIFSYEILGSIFGLNGYEISKINVI